MGLIPFASLILGAVTLERLAELWLADRNTSRLLANGAKEYGAAHYPLIVALHAVWLGTLWLLAWNAPVDLAWLAVFAVLQALRVWVLVTLGPRWTTRIIVMRGEPLVKNGPYRFMPHPNYAVVVGEMAVLPMIFDQPGFAALFAALNAAVIVIRVKAESAALSANAGR